MKTWKTIRPTPSSGTVIEIEPSLRLVASGAFLGNAVKIRAVCRLAGKAPELYEALRELRAAVARLYIDMPEFRAAATQRVLSGDIALLLIQSGELITEAVGEPVEGVSIVPHVFCPVHDNDYCGHCGAGFLHGVHV